MKSLMVTGLIGIAFFGGAYFISNSQLLKQTTPISQELNSYESDSNESIRQVSSQKFGSSLSGHPKFSAKENTIDENDSDLSQTAVLDIVNSLKAKEADLAKREKQVAAKEQKVTYILQDIRNEKKEVDELMETAKKQVAEKQLLVKQIEAKQLQLDSDIAAFEKTQKDQQAAYSESLLAANQELAKLFESLEPDDFAKTIEEYVDNDEITKIGEYLSYVEASKASKAINAIADAGLKRRVLEAVKEAFIKKQENQAAKYRKSRNR